MAFPSCICCPLSLKVNRIERQIGLRHNVQGERFASSVKNMSIKPFGHQGRMGADLYYDWSFLRGSRVVLAPKVSTATRCRKSFGVHASWLTTSQIASNAFTLGTAVVLPFYTLMVFAPKAELTKKVMESSIPFVVLGIVYACLLYLSWTPDTLKLMFASKYWLPELPGITKMFSNEMTIASGWIHYLVVDLYAARQIFLYGIENQVETRHSVALCLLFCPIGISTDFITRYLTEKFRK
ncbi:hypothetical protein SLA2020_152380 [Shorea laevis]